MERRTHTCIGKVAGGLLSVGLCLLLVGSVGCAPDADDPGFGAEESALGTATLPEAASHACKGLWRAFGNVCAERPSCPVIVWQLWRHHCLSECICEVDSTYDPTYDSTLVQDGDMDGSWCLVAPQDGYELGYALAYSEYEGEPICTLYFEAGESAPSVEVPMELCDACGLELPDGNDYTDPDAGRTDPALTQ